MNVIRSHKHDIYTEKINKLALSSDDDKRHILSDGNKYLIIRTLYDINIYPPEKDRYIFPLAHPTYPKNSTPLTHPEIS